MFCSINGINGWESVWQAGSCAWVRARREGKIYKGKPVSFQTIFKFNMHVLKPLKRIKRRQFSPLSLS